MISSSTAKAPGRPSSMPCCFGGQAYAFYRSIESAKIALSSAGTAQIDFRRPGLSLQIDIERAAFDHVIAPLLDRVMEQIDRALTDAGVGRSDVATVVRTGGSSQVPAFVDRLEDTFGAERVRARAALTSVAYGLGVIAMEERWEE